MFCPICKKEMKPSKVFYQEDEKEYTELYTCDSCDYHLIETVSNKETVKVERFIFC